MSLLESILATKRREVEALMASNSAASPRPTPRAPLDAVSALRRAVGASLRLIAEIKRKSPSAGPLSTVLGPSERALVYAEAGATMVSVLCDGPFFDGSWEHLALARRGLDVFRARVPLLAKEYVIDERQIVLARDHGGDAVLLIARIVTPARLAELARAARGEGIEPLLEVVDERELDAALAAGARIIGVNARDLDTLQIDTARAARVLGMIPPECVAVHLSGLRSADDVERIARGRADGALIGEALMRDDDPRPRLRSLVAAAEATSRR